MIAATFHALPRSEKDGAGTGVHSICTYRTNLTGHGLDRERLYWELSRLTHGVTKLGPYALDQASLYVNGEQWLPVLCCMVKPTTSPFCASTSLEQPLPHLFSVRVSAGYTHQTLATTPTSEYFEGS